MRGGRENDSEFGSRFIGNWLFADLLSSRFRITCERLGFDGGHVPPDMPKFLKPDPGGQVSLF